MPTRATYSLPSNLAGTETQCFYIHHDGYLEGAADYFKDMLKIQFKGVSLSNAFKRANQAEETGSHDQHTDTEFRYFVEIEDERHILTAYNEDYAGDSRYWKMVYKGPLECFVNYYAPKEKSVLKLTTILKRELIDAQQKIDVLIDAIEDLTSNG